MKELMRQVKSLIIFDFPLTADYIKTQFARTHQRFQTETPEWSTEATRQTLISHYWFSHVTAHFSLMIGLPFTVIFLGHTLLQTDFNALSILMAGILSYPILYIFLYRPNFSSFFLPRLQTAKEAYERRQLEKLEKCRQAQLSNFSLTLIFYVLTATNDTNSLKCDENSANLLMRLYGVDPGSLKKNLELVLGTSKRKDLSERKITELRNRFSETYNYLEELGYLKGIEKLREIEFKFFKT